MKKEYVTPSVELVRFHYRDQVVVASSKCSIQYVNTDGYVASVKTCTDGWIERRYLE